MPDLGLCEDCLYWQITTGGAGVAWGECRRYAPRPAEKGPASWPLTSDESWCGEFSRALEGQEAAPMPRFGFLERVAFAAAEGLTVDDPELQARWDAAQGQAQRLGEHDA